MVLMKKFCRLVCEQACVHACGVCVCVSVCMCVCLGTKRGQEELEPGSWVSSAGGSWGASGVLSALLHTPGMDRV